MQCHNIAQVSQEKHSMGMNAVKFGKASDRTMPQTQQPEKN